MKKIITKSSIPQGVKIVKDLDRKKIAESTAFITGIAHLKLTSLRLFEVLVAALDQTSGATQVAISKPVIYQSLGWHFAAPRQRSYLKQILTALCESGSVTLQIPTPTGVVMKPIQLVDHVIDDLEEDAIQVFFHPSVLPYITNLKKDFTEYDLQEIVGLKSKYALLLFRLLIGYYHQYTYYRDQPGQSAPQLAEFQSPDFTMTRLKQILALKGKYKKFGDFEKIVLKPALAEINTKTSLRVLCEKRRAEHRIGKLVFHLFPKPEPAASEASEPQLQLSSTPAKSAVTPAPAQVEATLVPVTQLLANPYTGLLLANRLVDPMALMQSKRLQRDLVQRLYPAYDQLVKQHSRKKLQRHLEYLGQHHPAIQQVVPYLLQALQEYATQLAKPKQAPARHRYAYNHRRGRIVEKLPAWAKELDQQKRGNPQKRDGFYDPGFFENYKGFDDGGS